MNKQDAKRIIYLRLSQHLKVDMGLINSLMANAQNEREENTMEQAIHEVARSLEGKFYPRTRSK